MMIKINDIPPEGLSVELDDTLDLFNEGGARTAAPVAAQLTLTPHDRGRVHVSGAIRADISLECSRCLKLFPYPVRDLHLDLDLEPKLAGDVQGEHELGRGELDTDFYEGDEIYPEDIVREQILLALPMVPVHREDCKGLCPVCGADRNEAECSCRNDALLEKENPFAALRKIIIPEKE